MRVKSRFKAVWILLAMLLLQAPVQGQEAQSASDRSDAEALLEHALREIRYLMRLATPCDNAAAVSNLASVIADLVETQRVEATDARTTALARVHVWLLMKCSFARQTPEPSPLGGVSPGGVKSGRVRTYNYGSPDYLMALLLKRQFEIQNGYREGTELKPEEAAVLNVLQEVSPDWTTLYQKDPVEALRQWTANTEERALWLQDMQPPQEELLEAGETELRLEGLTDEDVELLEQRLQESVAVEAPP
jgi:hypothetical protein